MLTFLEKLLLSILFVVFAAPVAVAQDQGEAKTPLYEGTRLLNTGNYDLALNEFRKVIESETASDDLKARARISMGRCYMQKEAGDDLRTCRAKRRPRCHP